MLLVGLGNPGMEFDATRHNVGFHILDTFVDDTWSQEKAHKALSANTTVDGVTVHLLKPQTFMNLSGEAVQSYASYYKIPVEAILVIHDEADLPFGDIRLKQGGGTAGHNGLKSLVQRLGTDTFWRLRFGIGRGDNPNVTLENFVLAKWTESEQQQLDQLVQQTLHKLHEFIVAPPQDHS